MRNVKCLDIGIEFCCGSNPLTVCHPILQLYEHHTARGTSCSSCGYLHFLHTQQMIYYLWIIPPTIIKRPHLTFPKKMNNSITYVDTSNVNPLEQCAVKELGVEIMILKIYSKSLYQKVFLFKVCSLFFYSVDLCSLKIALPGQFLVANFCFPKSQNSIVIFLFLHYNTIRMYGKCPILIRSPNGM